MLNLNVVDETAPLKAVVLGTAESCGPTPKPEEAYDPKSLEHIIGGYLSERSRYGQGNGCICQSFSKIRGTIVSTFCNPEDCNQIFSRDIAFVIEDKIFHANILPDREREFEAIQHVLDKIEPSKIIRPPEEVHIEGGDVMPWHDYIFVGTYTGPDYPDYITARTNKEAVEFLQEQFPDKNVKSFELRKSNTNAKENALHLDCCFQPVGKDKAIIHKNGFLVEEEYQWLVDFFGKEKVFEINADEMYQMFSNVFSISPEVVVSEKNFTQIEYLA